MDFPTNGTVQQAFPTPLLSCHWPADRASGGINRTLADLIADKQAAGPGVRRSLSGGWHSELDLFDWESDAVSVLAERVLACFQRITQASATVPGQMRGGLRLYGWANVTRPGGYNRVHNHAASMWSGVYYVDPGSPDASFPDSGVLEFVDPRLGSSMVTTPGRPFGGNLRVVPEEGLMVLFPSWLMHFVNPFEGTGERISISFNLCEARPGR